VRIQSKMLTPQYTMGYLSQLITPIIEECLENCVEADSRLGRNSSRVLAVMAGVSG
jgi:hypothetical protein